jgi:predicted esterase
MLVLPGGDGSADFKPFVTNIAQQALPDGYLVAQLVAPKWRDDENRIVWPTTKTRDAKMKFPTEAFIDSVARDVAAKFKIDSQHVYALGWSSGGPPVYAASMRDKTPLTGAFVAMSVFKPDELPPAKNAKGCAFYILHSPQDFIPMRFPQSAQTTLKAAGAKVQLTTYQGGHGWHGDIFGQIRAGVKWLDQQSPRSPTSKATSTSAPAK